MKIKIKITLSLLLLFVSLGLTAQSNNQTTLQKLINKTWVLSWDNPTNVDYAYKQQYTSTQLTESVITPYGISSSVAAFYLSNQIETSFDYSKVGNITDGRYIISFLPDLDGRSYFHVDEIITITDIYLETKSLKSGSTFKFNVQ
ncbi:MAG: hypothetical protein LBE11_03905 [Prevotellaceae bacterium]|jgi:hypothetical protein|nr:hypothetical protein [Prevotellaceae bacterium]